MPLRLEPLGAAHAEQVASWRYEAPYDVYDARVAELLEGGYLAILDDEVLVGFACVDAAARVPGGPPPGPAVTDVGIGIRPDLLGSGVGTRAGALVLEALRVGGRSCLRASVLSWNERSVALAKRLGFRQTGTFQDERDGRAFVVLEREGD